MAILSVHEGGYNKGYMYNKLFSDNLVFKSHLHSNLVNALRPDQMQLRKFH